MPDVVNRRLPFAPEPDEALRARVPAALAKVWDAAECERTGVCPSQLRENVFDFGDGFRVVVSVDHYPDGVENLHGSGSVAEGSLAEARCKIKGLGWAVGTIQQRLYFLTGRAMRLAFFTPKGTPHWFADWEGK